MTGTFLLNQILSYKRHSQFVDAFWHHRLVCIDAKGWCQCTRYNVPAPHSQFVWRLQLRQESCHLLLSPISSSCRWIFWSSVPPSNRTLISNKATPCNQFSPLKLSQCHQDRWKKVTTCLPQGLNPTVGGSADDNSSLIAFPPEILDARQWQVTRRWMNIIRWIRHCLHLRLTSWEWTSVPSVNAL